MKNIFLIASVALSLWGLVLGLKSILRGYFKPQRMSRFLFFLIFVLLFLTLLAQGDKNSIYVAFIAMISTFLIFVLSIKKGMGGASKFDFLILAMALIALSAWVLSNNPFLGLVMTILAGILAYIPTILKAIKFPETEDWFFYSVYSLASFFSLISIEEFTLAKVIFPVYLILANSLLVTIIIVRLKKMKK